MQNVKYTIGTSILPTNPKPLTMKDVLQSLKNTRILVDHGYRDQQLVCYFAHPTTGVVTESRYDIPTLVDEMLTRSEDESIDLFEYIRNPSIVNPNHELTSDVMNAINAYYPDQWLSDISLVYIPELHKVLFYNPIYRNDSTWEYTVRDNLRRLKPPKHVIDYRDLRLSKLEVRELTPTTAKIEMTYLSKDGTDILLEFSNSEFPIHARTLTGKGNTRPITNGYRRKVVESGHLWLSHVFGIVSITTYTGQMHTALIMPIDFDKYSEMVGESNITRINGYTKSPAVNPLPTAKDYEPKSHASLICNAYIDDVNAFDDVYAFQLSSGEFQHTYRIAKKHIPTWVSHSIRLRNKMYSPSGVMTSLRKGKRYVQASLLKINSEGVGLLSLKTIDGESSTVFLKDFELVTKYTSELKEHLPNNFKLLEI